MSRRLVNRSRSVASHTTTSSHAPEPPPYEPPSFPLNGAAAAKLGEISRVRDTAAYQSQIKDALRQLGHSVYDVQSRLVAQRTRLEQLRTRRRERGTDKQPEEDRVEGHIAQLAAEVDTLTRQSEAAVRAAIDQRVALEDIATTLGDLYTSTTELQPRVGEEEADDEPRSVPSTVDALRDQRARKRQEYEATPHYQRYALDNDYISFKKLWHDGAAGNDGPPLPDASRWFRSDGTPVMKLAGTRGPAYADAEADADQEDDEEDADEDVAVAREVLSLNCPLTLRPLQEPYGNRKCNHTFEKSAIRDYLKSGPGPMQCPQTGCNEVIMLSPRPLCAPRNNADFLSLTRHLHSGDSTRTSISTRSLCGGYSEPSRRGASTVWMWGRMRSMMMRPRSGIRLKSDKRGEEKKSEGEYRHGQRS